MIFIGFLLLPLRVETILTNLRKKLAVLLLVFVGAFLLHWFVISYVIYASHFNKIGTKIEDITIYKILGNEPLEIIYVIPSCCGSSNLLNHPWEKGSNRNIFRFLCCKILKKRRA